MSNDRVIQDGNELVVKLPSKDEMPTSNMECREMFGEAVDALLLQFNEAEKGSELKKKIRRQLRKIGYKLSEGRERGIIRIAL